MRYFLLGHNESVLARVHGHNHEYLKDAVWVGDAEVADLVHLGHAWRLPPEHEWSFPGHAREITAKEAAAFMKKFLEGRV